MLQNLAVGSQSQQNWDTFFYCYVWEINTERKLAQETD